MLDRTGQTLRTFAPIVLILPVCPHCHGLGYLVPKVDDASLIMAIADAVGTRMIFTIGELRAHSEVDDALRAVLANLSAWQIGKALRRISVEGKSFDGYGVERVSEERDGALWRITLTRE